MRLSPKQKAYWNAPFHRWNIKSGATRTGKTYLDYFMIPRRILERRGKDGLIVLMGNTRGTLQRNVLDPMAELYGPALVGAIRSDNTAELFGEKAYCLGADSRKHVDRLRGASIKYCYGDEVVTWCEDVFEMLKSRLDKAYSTFDGTCNPENPDHWFKKFLDSDADIFQQSYCLDDNPFLPESVRDALKKEYHGVFYERYILGQWAVAEGLVFPYFGEDTEKYVAREIPPPERVVIGIDFGGSGSMTAMTATGFYDGMRRLTALSEAALPVGAAIGRGRDCARLHGLLRGLRGALRARGLCVRRFCVAHDDQYADFGGARAGSAVAHDRPVPQEPHQPAPGDHRPAFRRGAADDCAGVQKPHPRAVVTALGQGQAGRAGGQKRGQHQRHIRQLLLFMAELRRED